MLEGPIDLPRTALYQFRPATQRVAASTIICGICPATLGRRER